MQIGPAPSQGVWLVLARPGGQGYQGSFSSVTTVLMVMGMREWVLQPEAAPSVGDAENVVRLRPLSNPYE